MVPDWIYRVRARHGIVIFEQIRAWITNLNRDFWQFMSWKKNRNFSTRHHPVSHWAWFGRSDEKSWYWATQFEHGVSFAKSHNTVIDTMMSQDLAFLFIYDFLHSFNLGVQSMIPWQGARCCWAWAKIRTTCAEFQLNELIWLLRVVASARSTRASTSPIKRKSSKRAARQVQYFRWGCAEFSRPARARSARGSNGRHCFCDVVDKRYVGRGRTGTTEEKGKNRAKTNEISHDLFEQGNILLEPMVLHSPMSSEIDIYWKFSSWIWSTAAFCAYINPHVSCGLETGRSQFVSHWNRVSLYPGSVQRDRWDVALGEREKSNSTALCTPDNRVHQKSHDVAPRGYKYKTQHHITRLWLMEKREWLKGKLL